MAKSKEKHIYVFKSGMYDGVNIERVPIGYINWFIESKGFERLDKSKKLEIIEYSRKVQGYGQLQIPAETDNTSEWHSISELPIFDSEVEVRPFTAILIFKGDCFIDSKGRWVSLELVDEWRYTDKYLQK
jgi:hypothetical protein